MRIMTLSVAALCATAAACNTEPASDSGGAPHPAAVGPAVPAASAAPVPASASAPAASAQADDATVRALIDRGLAGYRNTETLKGFDFTFSPEFKRIWARALGQGALDHDPVCSCQDFEPSKFRHRITSLRIAGDKAVAEIELDLGFDSGEKSPAKITLVRSPAGWLLDDIGNANLASYKQDMARAKPGSYGIP